jgi:hypothetical protein
MGVISEVIYGGRKNGFLIAQLLLIMIEPDTFLVVLYISVSKV